MTVTFPHANGYQISDDVFLLAWFEWFNLYGPETADPFKDAIPLLNRAVGFSNLLGQVSHFSLDVMCRLLVPSSYKNTMHTTKTFISSNSSLLDSVKVLNPATGREVNGARLTGNAASTLKRVIARIGDQLEDSLQRDVDSLIEADQDFDAPSNADIAPVILCNEPPADEDHNQEYFQCPNTANTLANVIDCFINLIDNEPWQPYYRGRLVPNSSACTGWGNRLQGYFWPNPQNGIAQTAANIANITAPLPNIVSSITGTSTPSTTTLNQAKNIANLIFRWGGVPQEYTTQDVVNVVRSAYTGTAIPGAPMNSGWTKLASFATAHLPGHEQVIWDSRVANSVIRRLDYILTASGHTVVPPFLKDIGTVTGRGGSRAKGMSKTLQLKWPNGYRKWSAQFAASAFIRSVASRMNALSIPVPPNLPAALWPTGTTPQVWNVRMVEMVLFMDGY